MSDLEIIDTFPVFLDFWAEAREKAIEDQIELWAGEYMSHWPELLEAQIQDYSEQNLDWKQIARERVFPYLQERLPAMQEARANLLRLSPIIFSKAEHTLNINTSTCFVIYVGIGCGAGWVTTYQGRYSILFGLENIAECGWSDPEAIAGVVAHEGGPDPARRTSRRGPGIATPSAHPVGARMTLRIAIEQEPDGRWLAEVSHLPGVLAYGATETDAIAQVQTLARGVLAERLEHGEAAP